MYVYLHYALHLLLAAALWFFTPAQGQPKHAPVGSTALCRDGSFSKSAQKRGACSRHQGVKTWYGAEPKPKLTPRPSTRTKQGVLPSAQDDPMVWVNLKSGVFHCQGSRWYGKTRHGQSMPQSQALAKKHTPSGNKSCAPNKSD